MRNRLFFLSFIVLNCAACSTDIKFKPINELRDLDSLDLNETTVVSVTDINSGGGLGYSADAGIYVNSSIGAVAAVDNAEVVVEDNHVSLGFMATVFELFD